MRFQTTPSVSDAVFVYSVGNSADMYDIAKRFTFQAILNAGVSVDTFFLLRYVFRVGVI